MFGRKLTDWSSSRLNQKCLCENIVVSRIKLYASVIVRHRNRLHVHEFIFSWERKLERTHTQLVYISVNIYIKESTECNNRFGVHISVGLDKKSLQIFKCLSKFVDLRLQRQTKFVEPLIAWRPYGQDLSAHDLLVFKKAAIKS